MKKFILKHKIASIIAALVVMGAGWYAYQTFASTPATTSYVLGTVTKGTIVASVSGSGQVSASSQIDLKPQASGQVTWVGIKVGDKVRRGQALVQLDDTTARQSVVSAEESLRQTQLQYQKDSAQAPVDYQNALDAVATASTTLANEYVTTFNTFSNTFLDLPVDVTGAQSILYGYDLSPTRSQWNVDVLTNMFTGDDRDSVQFFADKAKSDYKTADAKYSAGLLAYQQLDRSASTSAIDTLLQQSIDTATAAAQALQSELNFLGKVNDLATKNNRPLPAAVTTMQTNARGYLSTVNSDLSSLLAEQKALSNDKQSIKTALQSLSLLKVGNSVSNNDPLSLQISKSNLDKQTQDVANAKDALADYTVTAPFDGTIASVSANVGDSAGSSVATIVSTGSVASLSLNEVDAAKVKLNDKATLTFDAIEGLTLTGTVAEIDPVGTVSQGVVSYDIKIQFTTQDARVKPGMTVNAAIQTAVHPDVLTVPSSAVKTQNGQSYVLAFVPALPDATSSSPVTSATAPTQIPVETGISDDTTVEILSGLTEGEQIVVRTISSGAKTTTTSGTGGAGVRTGGGNATLIRAI